MEQSWLPAFWKQIEKCKSLERTFPKKKEEKKREKKVQIVPVDLFSMQQTFSVLFDFVFTQTHIESNEQLILRPVESSLTSR